ncbi:MAG: hypothetical protein JWR36_1647 [Glaciihabitans sp.]|jgi:hypothetical protein|nr:hypothetical protein [Glaciihabitans sp.]MDQ1571292.1 hypothetical protein [Actinomycetota bacterium]
MSRLPAVLSRREFPAAELDALRLDGEVYRVDDCAVPVDILATPGLRATVLCGQLPDRFIAEQHSAAWVWGAAPHPPVRHEVCSDIVARARPVLGAPLRIREVVLSPADTTSLCGLVLTTPVRTAIDLARSVSTWNEVEARILAELMRIGGFDAVDCARAINQRRNLPNKLVALDRLAHSDSIEWSA